jgi:large subunit ribosomal protein L10
LLNQSKGVIFTEYRGLKDRDLKKLRGEVRDARGIYRITKMTLLKIALEQAGYPIPEELIGRPVAVGFCLEEVPAVAKALTDYARTSDLMSVRSGIIGGQIMTESQVKMIADLPSLDELRAMILGLLDAPASNLVGVLQAGVGSVVNVLHAYTEKGEAA